MFGDFQDLFIDVTLMANSFNLRWGRLSMCPGDTVLRRAADESRAARSQASPFICACEASKQVTKADVAVSNWLLFLGTLRVGYQDRGVENFKLEYSSARQFLLGERLNRQH